MRMHNLIFALPASLLLACGSERASLEPQAVSVADHEQAPQAPLGNERIVEAVLVGDFDNENRYLIHSSLQIQDSDFTVARDALNPGRYILRVYSFAGHGTDLESGGETVYQAQITQGFDEEGLPRDDFSVINTNRLGGLHIFNLFVPLSWEIDNEAGDNFSMPVQLSYTENQEPFLTSLPMPFEAFPQGNYRDCSVETHFEQVTYNRIVSTVIRQCGDEPRRIEVMVWEQSPL